MRGRFTAIVVLAGAIAAGLVYEAGERDEADESAEVGVVPGVAMPTARAEPTLSSTWFCAGGTAHDDGSADHVVVIANPTDEDRTATLTVLTGSVAPAPALPDDSEGEEGEEGDDEGEAAEETTTTASTTTTTAGPPTTAPPPPTEEVAVPAWDRVEVRLGDIVEAQLAGAIVEIDGGEVVVEHHVTGDLGRATAPCSTTASPTWSFPWGVTTRGNRQLLVFMNPFPDDATVDIDFATDEGVRDTARFQGFVVPGRSVVGAFIDQDVTRKAQVSSQVRVRGGRLVVDRIQLFDGTDGRRGMDLALGVPAPAETWVFPAGETGDGLLEQVVVFNPSEDVAEVEVEVRLDEEDELGPPEPFALTVPPGRYSIVDLHAEERIPESSGHALIVRSMNGVPITAERVNAAGDPADNEGITSVAGAPFGGPTWYLAAGGPSTEEGRDEIIVVFNLSDEEEVTYDLTGFDGGQTIAIQDQQDQVVAPGGRAVIRLGDHLDREELAVMVSASGPVVVERGLHRIGGLGLSQSLGIPSAIDVVVPEPRGL